MAPDGFILTLADGTRLAMCSGDAEAAPVVASFAAAARLVASPSELPSGTRRLLVVTGVEQESSLVHARPSYMSAVPAAVGDVICVLVPRDALHPRRRADETRGLGFVLEPLSEEQWFWQQLVRISAAIGRETHSRGGVLLHSGLAALPPTTGTGRAGRPSARVDRGILLAGRSGVGKSTASRRLPPPWQSLADDLTLLVRDAAGAYWAHPWPTWSWFFGKEDSRLEGGTWDVQQAVPLHAIFFLEQGEEERAELMGPGHAVCLLTELAQQTSRHYLRGLPLDEIAAFNLRRFDNLCALTQAVPAYSLHVSREGAFWEEVERVLRESRRRE